MQQRSNLRAATVLVLGLALGVPSSAIAESSASPLVPHETNARTQEASSNSPRREAAAQTPPDEAGTTPLNHETSSKQVRDKSAVAPSVDESALKQAHSRVRNLFVVSPQLLRGGQPKDGGLELLKRSGVRTVISLLDEDDSKEEKAEAEKLGLKFYNLPMRHSKPVPKETVDKFLSIMEDESNQPVFMHCKKGEDRSAALCAIYRMRKQGWTAADAYKEMIDTGFHSGFEDLSYSVFRYGSKDGPVPPPPMALDD